MPADHGIATDSRRRATAARAGAGTEAHARVTLHPDDERQPRSWQTPTLCSPRIVLEEDEGRWMARLNFVVRLEGHSPEDLVAQLYDRHGIEARLDPVAA